MTKPRSAAPTADTSGLSTATRDALASILIGTTPPAPALSPTEASPFDRPHRCGICGEHYSAGHAIHNCSSCRTNGFDPNCTVGFTYWPDGELAYYDHARESVKHQMVGQIADRQMGQLLAHMPEAISEARTHQKLMRNPAYTPLRRLFR